MEGDNADGTNSCSIREYTTLPTFTNGRDPAKTPNQDASGHGK